MGKEEGRSIWADSAAFWRMTPELILEKVNSEAGRRSAVYNHDHDFTRYCQNYLILILNIQHKNAPVKYFCGFIFSAKAHIL